MALNSFFVYSLVFRFKFFHGISLEIRARSDAGPGLIYSALPKMGKADGQRRWIQEDLEATGNKRYF